MKVYVVISEHGFGRTEIDAVYADKEDADQCYLEIDRTLEGSVDVKEFEVIEKGDG